MWAALAEGKHEIVKANLGPMSKRVVNKKKNRESMKTSSSVKSLYLQALFISKREEHSLLCILLS